MMFRGYEPKRIDKKTIIWSHRVINANHISNIEAFRYYEHHNEAGTLNKDQNTTLKEPVPITTPQYNEESEKTLTGCFTTFILGILLVIVMAIAIAPR
jgi:hypothetical protein